MRALAFLTFIVAASASWAAAQDLRPDQALAAQQFADIDADEDGRLTPEEFLSYGDLVFTSMDSDESGSLDTPEFLGWGFGMHNLADEAGARQGYDTAIRVIFDLWDRDNDGAVLLNEQRDAQGVAFAFADADEDGSLGAAEFADNYILNVALKTALTVTPSRNHSLDQPSRGARRAARRPSGP